MNKMLMFPMAFMFLLTIYATIYTGASDMGTTNDYSSQEGFIFNDTGTEQTGSVDIPSADAQTFNLWESEAAIAIMMAAIAIGIVAGIKILGSGLSDISQTLIYQTILFMGIWACLSVFSSSFMFENAFTEIIWIGMTITYVIGLGMHFNTTGG